MSFVVRFALAATCWLVVVRQISCRASNGGSDKCGGIQMDHKVCLPVIVPAYPLDRELEVVLGSARWVEFHLANAGTAPVSTASPAGDQLEPRRRMEGSHQHVHPDHSIQRRCILRGRAQHVRATTKTARKQRHDGEGRRGGEAYPIGRAEGGRCTPVCTCPA